MTRLVNVLGANLPSDLIPPAADNPTGFWESTTVTQLNDALLATRGATWHSAFRSPPDFLQHPEVAALREEAAAFLRAEFAGVESFVLKDPRMCRLVPFWLAVLDDVGADVSAVLVIRLPNLVAKSLRARDRMRRGAARALWLDHILMAEQATRRIPRAVLSFDRLLADPVGTAERAAAAIGLDQPDADGAWQSTVRQFIGPNLARQSSPWGLPGRLLGNLRADQAVYRRLVASPDGHLAPDVREFLDDLARRRESRANPAGLVVAPRLPGAGASSPQLHADRRGHLAEKVSPGLHS